MEENLQVEDGNYTRIVNTVLEELVKLPLLGAEFAICLFVIRKTWGFGKKDDHISLSQFQAGTGRSRPTIVKALKNLEVVKILLPVRAKARSGKITRYSFNKYVKSWEVVKRPKLVKQTSASSKEKLKKVVKRGLHTKENTKENTKEKAGQAQPVVDLIEAFGVLNPAMKRMYGNTTQRTACENLIGEYGLNRVMGVVKNTLPRTNAEAFFPTILTPHQLFQDWKRLEAAIHKWKSKQEQRPAGKGLVE